MVGTQGRIQEFVEGGSAGVGRCCRARSAIFFLHYVHTQEAFSCHFVRRRKELQQIDTLCTLGSGRSTATGICSTQLRLIPHMWYNISGIVPRPLIRSGYETNEKPNGYVWADRPSDDQLCRKDLEVEG